MAEVETNKFTRLDLVHHLSAGMKAVYTTEFCANLDIIRVSLGGAGFSSWSGIPWFIEANSPHPTHEGDNTVMAQQSCNLLLKLGELLSKNKNLPLPSGFDYMRESFEQSTSRKFKGKIHSAQDFLKLDLIQEALQVTASYKLKRILTLMREAKVPRVEFVNSLFAVDLVELCWAHIRYLTFFLFRQNLETSNLKCQNLKKILTDLCMLYGLSQIKIDSSVCYQTGYFESGQPINDHLLGAIKILLAEIRPQAVNIVESMKVPDFYL